MVAAVKIDSERSRIRAALVNSGRYSFEEADDRLSRSQLSVHLDDDTAKTAAGQAAFLTAVVTGVRCFGEVNVQGALGGGLLVPVPLEARTIGDAAAILGARFGPCKLTGRTICIGDRVPNGSGWSVRAFWDGWIAGVRPRGYGPTIGRGDCVLAGIGSGALAVGQAFLAEQGDPRAGEAVQVLSLWRPDLGLDDASDPGPDAFYLPEGFWLFGLGNLGQAYLWAMCMLPFDEATRVLVFLQDDDLIEEENWGTSILVQRGRYGILKTLVAEEWVCRRGFRARRIDRRLDRHLRCGDREPAIALAGLDAIPARRLLGLPGFGYVIDAGLGATAADYQKFRVNVFGKGRDPAQHFAGVEDDKGSTVQGLMELPAYKELARSQNDGGCGAALLAGRSVAVPFVSAFVGAIVMTQAIRIASGESPHLVLTGILGDLRSLRATLGKRVARPTFAYSLASSGRLGYAPNA